LTISVIISTHNRPASLHRLLDSLSTQFHPGEHELFIAENGSPNPSELPPLPFQPVHLFDPVPGKCRIQNRAIAIARGTILAFLDDDLVVTAGYLGNVSQFFAEHPEFGAMKGRILAAADPAALAGSRAVYLDLPLVDHGERVTEVRGMIGANMAIRAAVLRRVGNFDERLGPGAAGHEEETEMSARIRRAGFKIGYAPAAAVYHDVDRIRADRDRFIRIARERGYCRTLHERHGPINVICKLAMARMRLAVAQALHARPERLAREEKRFAILCGIRDGLRQARETRLPALKALQ
jgi:GT2 family glycosyltransferase